MIQNVMQRALPSVSLLVLYLLLTQNVQVSNLVIGTLVSVGLTLLLGARSTLSWRRWPVLAYHVLGYGVRLAWDVVLNGLIVASMVLWRRHRLNAEIVPFPAKSRSDLGKAVQAHGITISPGQMVVGFENDKLLVHCLDAKAAGQPKVDDPAVFDALRRTLD